MRIDILTCQPELLASPFAHSIVRRAQDKGLAEIHLHQLREHAINKHGQIDDYVFGGGAGMVLRVEPIAAWIDQLQAERQQQEPSALPNEPKPSVISSAVQRNEPEPVTPIRPTPPVLEPSQPTLSSMPDEPEPTAAPMAAKPPNDPKLTRQQRRWAERQRNHEHKQS